MKAIIIMTGVFFGIFFGMMYGLDKQKPLFWRLITVVLVIILTVLTFLPPIGANFEVSKYLGTVDKLYSGNVLVYTNNDSPVYNQEKNLWEIKIWNNSFQESEVLIFKGKNLPAELKTSNKLVLKLKYDATNKEYHYISTESINPILTFPLVPGLEEQIRIMNFHVPVAWISVLAYLFAMLNSVGYLRKRDLKYDMKAATAAEIGLLFTILATVTGMIWAKLNWGSFWNWDPRETSIFILLLIYGAYFALRAAIENEDARARLSSVYSIVAFITVPFLVFVLPRILEGLHPGSENDSTAGPVLSAQKNTLNYLQQITFSLGFAAFSLLFFWLYNIKYRIKKINSKIN